MSEYSANGTAVAAQVGYASLTTSYAGVLAGSNGDYLLARNGTDKDVSLRLTTQRGAVIELLLPAGDIVPVTYAVAHHGTLEAKVASAASSGVLYLQSYPSGGC